MNVKYVSTDGLARFLSNLQTALASNSASSFKVNYATSADKATNDASGNPIATYYAKSADLTTLDGRVTTLDGQNIKTINFTPSGATSPTALTPTSGAVAIDLSGYALKSEVASAMDYKGSATGAELAAKTAANTRSGDVYTCSADSGNFHAGLEYVAVVSGTAPSQTLAWEELGKWVDLSGYVQKKAAANGYIATFDSNGDVISTGVSKDILQNGSVASDNSSFVTGGQVFTVTNALRSDITALENAGFVKEVKVNGTALTETSGAVNIDVSAYTDQTFSASSTSEEPIAHKAVAAAIAGFANVYDDSSTPAHVDNLYEATSDDIDAMFTAS